MARRGTRRPLPFFVFFVVIGHDHHRRPRVALLRRPFEPGRRRSGGRGRGGGVAEGGDEVEHRGEPLGGPAAQGPAQRLRHVQRNVAAAVQQPGERRRVAHWCSGEALVRERRQRVLIRARPRLAGTRFVGRYLEHPPDQEVAHLHPLVRAQEDAVGSQTSVRQAPPMRVVQRARHLLQDADAGPDLQRADRLEHVLERATVHALRGVPQEVVGAAEAKRRQDVRVLELHGGFGGAREPIRRRSQLLARDGLERQ